MNEPGFDAQVSHDDGDTVIKLHGNVNREAEGGLAQAYELAREGEGRVILDFVDVEYINSTGIALIVGLLARARADSRPVAAFGLTSHYQELFQITRLSDFMTIYDSATAAAVGE